MKRKIITIDQNKCNGCGQCVPNCPEGAIQVLDGKARLVSDLFCDGLGACIGECPLDAISIEEREAQPYDERRVLENIIPQGEAVLKAHLRHLDEHGERGYLAEALHMLEERGIPESARAHGSGGCPGSRVQVFEHTERETEQQTEQEPVRPAARSRLTQWPVQLHLVPPAAPVFEEADLLLSADCVAHAVGGFHERYLKGKKLAIACPKLDTDQQVYLEKLVALIDFARVRSITVMTMQVPCCGGLLNLARRAAAEAERSVPIEWIQISVQGDVLRRETIQE